MDFNISNINRLKNDQNYDGRHLPGHMLEAAMMDALCELLLSRDHIQSRLEPLEANPGQQIGITAFFDLLRDFNSTLRALPADHPKMMHVSIKLKDVTAHTKDIIPDSFGRAKPFPAPSSPSKAIIVNIKDAFYNFGVSESIVNLAASVPDKL